MTAHRDLTTTFRRGIFTGTLPPGVTGGEAARRFAVYRNNVLHSLSRALVSRFPVVERLVGADFFAAMAPVYIAADPPKTPMLFQWGSGFPRFVARFPPLSGLPYLRDVARLEWLRGQAWHAADAAPLPPAALAQAAGNPLRLRFTLHPSVALLRSDHAVVSIWQANQPGVDPPSLNPLIPETALVLRDRNDRVPVVPLDPGEAMLLDILIAGGTLGTAAASAQATDPRHESGRILGILATTGAITDLKE